MPPSSSHQKNRGTTGPLALRLVFLGVLALAGVPHAGVVQVHVDAARSGKVGFRRGHWQGHRLDHGQGHREGRAGSFLRGRREAERLERQERRLRSLAPEVQNPNNNKGKQAVKNHTAKSAAPGQTIKNSSSGSPSDTGTNTNTGSDPTTTTNNPAMSAATTGSAVSDHIATLIEESMNDSWQFLHKQLQDGVASVRAEVAQQFQQVFANEGAMNEKIQTLEKEVARARREAKGAAGLASAGLKEARVLRKDIGRAARAVGTARVS